jgi:acylphosphatase
VFEGPEEKVQQAIAWCRQGPPFAKVAEIEVIEEKPENLTTLKILR